MGMPYVSHRRHGGLFARFMQDGTQDHRAQQVELCPALRK